MDKLGKFLGGAMMAMGSFGLGSVLGKHLGVSQGYNSGITKGYQSGMHNAKPTRVERKDVNSDGVEDLIIRNLSEDKYTVLFGIPKDLLDYVPGVTRGKPYTESSYVPADILKQAMDKRRNSSSQEVNDMKYSQSLDDAVKSIESEGNK